MPRGPNCQAENKGLAEFSLAAVWAEGVKLVVVSEAERPAAFEAVIGPFARLRG